MHGHTNCQNLLKITIRCRAKSQVVRFKNDLV